MYHPFFFLFFIKHPMIYFFTIEEIIESKLKKKKNKKPVFGLVWKFKQREKSSNLKLFDR